MTPYTATGVGDLILTGFLFGFGFAIAQTLWSLLVSLVQSRRNPP